MYINSPQAADFDPYSADLALLHYKSPDTTHERETYKDEQ